MERKDFYYDLPKERIAQDPLADRTASRLLVLDRKTGSLCHRHFYDILDYLRPGDCLVLNDSKVIPARLYGQKADTGANAEILLLKRLNQTDWECLVRPGKKLRAGAALSFGGSLLQGKILEALPDGNRILRFSYEGVFEEVLDKLGEMPLPPYIRHRLKDRSRYNTVYARQEGSAAAPTAGLHWTQELLAEAVRKGISTAYVTLHVGLGTFRPVKAEKIEDHLMHSEYYSISEEAAAKMNRAREAGGRIVCTGTTSCRTLETAAGKAAAGKEGTKGGDGEIRDGMGRIEAGSGWTDIFIYPGYRFRATDALITNFHLPESTLLMLVSAFAGRERILTAYQEAVKEKYRFFSFGDAMLII